MPRVGSSKMIAFGFMASHFASTTFCWLPPDSEPVTLHNAGSPDVELASAPLSPLHLGVLLDDIGARVGVQVGQRDVLRDGKVEQETGALAVLRHKEHAGMDRVCRCRKLNIAGR